MAFRAAKCPNCGGDLQVPDNKDVVKCMYCGHDIIVREAIKLVIGSDVGNLMKLANAALASGNNKEAYDYYTKVLETDSNNSDAWFGKASAAGWMSTLANDRIPEMITCLGHAIECESQENKEKRELEAV
ncbi:MAG: hypothetical protein L0Y79_01495, partial [Chlorobi bacterium]|nr:hypothetical protein [Chlorobiota bacterium]